MGPPSPNCQVERRSAMTLDGARTVSGSMKSGARMLSFEQPFERSAVHGKIYHRFVCCRDCWLDLAKHVFQIYGVDASGRACCGLQGDEAKKAAGVFEGVIQT